MVIISENESPVFKKRDPAIKVIKYLIFSIKLENTNGFPFNGKFRLVVFLRRGRWA